MNLNLVLLGAGVTALATALGSLPVLVLNRLTANMRNILLGFSAGVMLAATSFSLINPALQLAEAQGRSPFSTSFLTGFSLLLGAGFLFLCHKYVPHEHFEMGREGSFSSVHLKRIWLFVFAITLHNFPEGLAVGSGVGSQDFQVALPILVGIGLQDMPEGFVVAAALLGVGYSRFQSIGVAVLTGLVEALAAGFGYLLTSFVTAVLPWTLAFAGGAMLWVVIVEMIPEMREKGSMTQASAGLMAGYVLMMILDVTLA